MKQISFISEPLLGIAFVFGGVNGLLIPLGYDAVLPVNPESAFAVILSHTDYIFIPQKIVELSCGVLLLTRSFRLVALIALTPVVVCILLYHLFDDRSGLPAGISVFVLYIISLTAHKKGILFLINK